MQVKCTVSKVAVMSLKAQEFNSLRGCRMKLSLNLVSLDWMLRYCLPEQFVVGVIGVFDDYVGPLPELPAVFTTNCHTRW